MNPYEPSKTVSSRRTSPVRLIGCAVAATLLLGWTCAAYTLGWLHGYESAYVEETDDGIKIGQRHRTWWGGYEY